MAEVAAGTALLPARPEMTESRRRLFEAAIVLFGERGYHGVSVRDIAAELGVKAPALYAHVPSKQHLLFELVMIGHEEHRDQLKAALLDTGPDPVEQIKAIVRAHVLAHLRYADLARVTARELRSLSGEQLAAVLLTRSQAERMFVDVVARGVQLGAFTVSRPTLVMNAIADLGIRTAEWWTPEHELTPAEIAEEYAGLAVRMLS